MPDDPKPPQHQEEETDPKSEAQETRCAWGSRGSEIPSGMRGGCLRFDPRKFFPKNRLQAERGPLCEGRFALGEACEEGGVGCTHGPPPPWLPPCKKTSLFEETCSRNGSLYLLRQIIPPEDRRRPEAWESDIGQRGGRVIERIHECLEWLAENEHIKSEEAQLGREGVREFIDTLFFATEGGKENHLRNQVIRALETAGGFRSGGGDLTYACDEARTLIRCVDNTLGEKLMPQRNRRFLGEETELSKRLRTLEESAQKERSIRLRAMREEGKSEEEQLAYSRDEHRRRREQLQAIENEPEEHELLLQAAVEAWAAHQKQRGAKDRLWVATGALLIFLFGEDKVPKELDRTWRQWLEKRPRVPRPKAKE